jgi:hypothetical protein
VGLRRGGILAAGSVAASAVTTLCSLLATIVLLRVLPREQAGRFAFLVELLYSVGLLGTMGQSVLQARLYYQHGAGHFDWVRDIRSTLWITTPIIAAAVMTIAGPYQLRAGEIFFLVLGAELFVLTSCFSAVLAQQRHYNWSSALVRLGNGLMIMSAVAMLLRPGLCRLDFALVSLIVFLGVVTVLGALLMRRWLDRGPNQITLSQRVTGLVFLASLLALVVPQRGVIVIAGALVQPGAVAALAALFSILRVFDLIGESVGRVFSTEMAQHSARLNAGLLVAPWILGGLLSIAVLVALPPIVHRFYSGRYDLALPLLPWLVGAAAFRLVEMVPRGFIGYLAPPRTLHQFAGTQCAAAIAGILLMVVWTRTSNLDGLVRAAAVISFIRLVISYGFVIPLRRGTASRPVGENVSVEPLQAGSEELPV